MLIQQGADLQEDRGPPIFGIRVGEVGGGAAASAKEISNFVSERLAEGGTEQTWRERAMAVMLFEVKGLTTSLSIRLSEYVLRKILASSACNN